MPLFLLQGLQVGRKTTKQLRARAVAASHCGCVNHRMKVFRQLFCGYGSLFFTILYKYVSSCAFFVFGVEATLELFGDDEEKKKNIARNEQ